MKTRAEREAENDSLKEAAKLPQPTDKVDLWLLRQAIYVLAKRELERK